MSQLIKVLFTGVLMIISLNVYAQEWKGPCRHHEFQCYRLERKGYPMILAAKTCHEWGLLRDKIKTVINIKVKSPYSWRPGIYDARISLSLVDHLGRIIESEMEYRTLCRDGWIYYTVELFETGAPYSDLIMTIYADNKWGYERTAKKTVKLNLYELDTDIMPMNYNMGSYW